MNIELPEFSLVLLLGASGSGKSTFAAQHLLPTEVVSSDRCRALVSDDETDQSVSSDAFELLHFTVAKRLKLRRLTVVDATNTRRESRARLLQIARDHHCLSTAIVIDLPVPDCVERNSGRSDRDFGSHVIRRQSRDVRRSVRYLKKEGFRYVNVLRGAEEIDAATIERRPLWCDHRDQAGPFDLVGDVHGCFDELVELLQGLGYSLSLDGPTFDGHHPDGRRVVFLGDLVDRGPAVPDVLRLVMGMVASGNALCVPGNHENKLTRVLRGKKVQLKHGLAETMEQLGEESEEFVAQVRAFIAGLISHLVLDGGRLVAAHAGLRESMVNRASGAVRSFALYGDTTGEIDSWGLPVRANWAAEYRGKATIVYGHTPTLEAEWINRTICLDTGCVFGGKLTALRWPEKEIVSVPARQVWCEPTKPLDAGPSGSGQQLADRDLDLGEVIGDMRVQTRLRRSIRIRAGHTAAALELLSRFAADPRWLIYLPPTMSPSETTARPGLLEHPDEAFAYYRERGTSVVVCEEKHMGSRAVVIACRDAAAAERRFGVPGHQGTVFTRTGRPFFKDRSMEAALVARVAAAMEAAGLWEELETDWVLLDCELMPWSAKARELLAQQYGPVGVAGSAALAAAQQVVAAAASRLASTTVQHRAPARGTSAEDLGAGSPGVAAAAILERLEERAVSLAAYQQSWRPYCWAVGGLDDYRLAPFHLLASEGRVHDDRDHVWHMETLARLAATGDPLLVATPWRTVDLHDATQVADAVAWWEQHTGSGGEGMVVKPLDFIAQGERGLLQPAVKCRGREYLRIIYGPEYTSAEHLDRLRERGVGRKRGLALKEFAVGLEGVHRFVERKPLRAVHQCAFGVLALESEPVDPRL